MSPIALLPDLPGCCIEQVNSIQDMILITARATASSASCPDCQQPSTHIHSYYRRSPMTLPSSGRRVRLLLEVRRFRCLNPACGRKTFAEPLPLLVAPHAQRTRAVQDLLRVLGEVVGGEAGARLSHRLAMACSPDTLLRLVRRASLPASSTVRVLGVDEWAWRKRQSYGTILVDLEKQVPIDLLADASAESFAGWLQVHPSVEIISRDRGTTFADGATRGAPHALQIADRWHLLHNLSETVEKVLARHHADLKRVFQWDEEPQTPQPSQEELQARMAARSQAEQVQQARRQRRLATFAKVHELSAQGWSFASIARILGMNKKTVRQFAQSEQFPESRPRSDRGRKLAPYVPYLQAQWAAGEHNIAHLYQTIRTQGYRGSETSVRTYLTSLREEIGPPQHPRRYYPPVPRQKKRQQRLAVSSRRATWFVLRRPEDLSGEDQQTLALLCEAHAQVKAACLLAQAFARMIRSRNASVLEPWLEEATSSEVPELRTFAAGIRRDQAAVQAALTYKWSQGPVEGQIHRLKLLKRQAYGRAGFELLRHRVLARSA